MENIDIILVEPQLPENIGMVARAMLNFNFYNLTIVNPKDKDFYTKAINPSAKAFEKINIVCYSDVESAFKNYTQIIALTARPRYINKPSYNLKSFFDNVSKEKQKKDLFIKEKIAVCFGCEKSGLPNSIIAISNYIINIKTNHNFSSLNLANAVGIFCYEYYNYLNKNSNLHLNKHSKLATQEDLSYFFKDLELKLAERNFFTEENKKKIALNNVKNIYMKANLSKAELGTLMGIHKMLMGKKD